MNILVALDLSESSKIVVEQAKKFAKALSAKIWLLHVADPNPELAFMEPGADATAFFPDSVEVRDAIAKKFHNEHTQLHQISQELSSAEFDCTALLIQGPTTETILNEVAKLSIDIVILGSQKKGAVESFFLGSTSKGVLHKSPVPVLIVPPHNAT
jgi:nucleotide-binding universal stress UspA family protein